MLAVNHLKLSVLHERNIHFALMLCDVLAACQSVTMGTVLIKDGDSCSVSVIRFTPNTRLMCL